MWGKKLDKVLRAVATAAAAAAAAAAAETKACMYVVGSE
jgi:ribosomal protein L12E/L44/L45/RPP1/RPP2